MGKATYILKLEDDCWYVGVSSDLKHRLTKHFKGMGASFTKKHKPLEVAAVYQGDCEKSATHYAISKYGKANVRGYGWTACN
jgi:predicted GIY-YIG superfamily endonuclease